MFAIDFVVVALSAVLFSLELGLFSLVALFISTKVMDMIMEGLSRARMVYIITDHWEQISEKIMADMERGVTRMAATGVYTGEPKGMLLCVLERQQGAVSAEGHHPRDRFRCLCYRQSRQRGDGGGL